MAKREDQDKVRDEREEVIVYLRMELSEKEDQISMLKHIIGLMGKVIDE